MQISSAHNSPFPKGSILYMIRDKLLIRPEDRGLPWWSSG